MSCRSTSTNKKKPIGNEYCRELDPKFVDMWVKASDAEEAGMPLNSERRAILTTYDDHAEDRQRVGLIPVVPSMPLSKDWVMALATLCSTTRPL